MNGSTITPSSTFLNVTTNENATCDYSSSFIYCFSGDGVSNGGGCAGGGSSSITMNITGEKQHLQNIQTSSAGNYTLNVRCSDSVNNSNSTSVTFFVALPQPGDGGGGGAPANITKPYNTNLSLKIISPLNNTLIFDNSLWLNVSTNKFSNCQYSLDSEPFTDLQEAEKYVVILPPGIEVSGDAWLVGTSNHLELSEDGSTSDTVETLRNITTYIDKSNLHELASGSVTNNKVTSPYNQYMYLLGPGTESKLDTGYVIYTENDEDTTADFLYFKSGREIARYLLEFTTALESDVDDSNGAASATGLFLTDYQDVDIKMFGKTYTIVTAKRTSTVGNNVVLTLMGGVAKDTLLEKQTRTYSISGKDYDHYYE